VLLLGTPLGLPAPLIFVNCFLACAISFLNGFRFKIG
jgi:hypothetical protein